MEDIRTEGDVPANPGAIQPATSGASLSLDEACERLANAEKDARRRLECDPSSLPGCPERLRLAGSLVCTEVDEGSVDGCVEAIEGYRFCSDFDARPCVVTVVADTCKNPFEGGVVPPPEGGPPDGSLEGGQPEGSVPPPSEGGAPDAAPDSGPVSSDAAPG